STNAITIPHVFTLIIREKQRDEYVTEVFTDNEKAIALYTKFGFEKEGVLRKASLKNGQYCDVMAMSIIKN
uniref:GNAT family N-acetyltransferase n=2 Tax=Xenorhabdus bovienii TaxID=40576 RepID=UPI00056ED99C